MTKRTGRPDKWGRPMWKKELGQHKSKLAKAKQKSTELRMSQTNERLAGQDRKDAN